MKRIIKVLLVAVVLSLIPMSYASAQWKYKGTYSEGLAYVEDAKGKCGFIDETGEVVIPCKWKCVWNFYDGLASVKDANGKEYIIDKTGKIVK